MALRCSYCDIDYPTWSQHKTCQVCGAFTWDNKDQYDENWRTRVTDGLNARNRARTGETGTQLAMAYPHEPDVVVTVHKVAGILWIVHQDLVDAGYTHLEPFSIIYVNEEFYELQGHTWATYRILNQHYANGAWWVEKVATEGVCPETPPS